MQVVAVHAVVLQVREVLFTVLTSRNRDGGALRCLRFALKILSHNFPKEWCVNLTVLSNK